jgi:hypothetical protein
MSERKRSAVAEKTNGDVKQIVAAAAEYLKSLLGEVGGMRLEEIEEKTDQGGWLVTLSFVPQLQDRDLPFLTKREYKQVEINSAGHPVAMRIRKVE